MHWTLHPVGGPWTVAILAIGMLAMCAVPMPGLSPARKAILLSLRVAIVLLMLLALLRPEVVRTKTEILRAALPILIDTSRSMTVEDSLGGNSRWQSAVELIEQSQGSLSKLSEANDIAFYRFDSTLTPLNDVDQLRAAEPTGERTAMGLALDQLLRSEASERLLGVLLLSDGAQRAVPPDDLAPQVAARRYALEGVPIFPFSFGTPSGGDRADLAIDDLLASNSVFAGTPTQVSAQLRVRGFANRQLTVQLLWEDDTGELQVVDTTRIQSGPEAMQRSVALEHIPQQLGEHKVQIRVQTLEGEVLTNNNAESTFVTVREGGVGVLFLTGATRPGGGPGVEQRFTRAALAASPDISVTRRLINYQPAQLDLSAELEDPKWDVFVLDDVDAEGLSREAWQTLAQRVRQGAGLIMTGGYHSFGPGGHGSSPLATLLPVSPSKLERQPFGEALRQDVHLTGPLRMLPTEPVGIRHPAMQISDQPAKLWSQLPALSGANQLHRQRLKPNAQVLAVADAAGNPPLLVAGQPGRGRVLAFAGDSTWRWAMGGHGDAHRRFWRQAILWLAQQDDNRRNPVWLELAARRVARGAALDLTAGTNTAPGSPPVDLSAQLTLPDGSASAVTLVGNANLSEAVLRTTDQSGDYTVTIRGMHNGQVVGQAKARFTVPPTDVELDQPAADPGTMAQLAQITEPAGGRALAPEELPDLLADLAAQRPQVQEEVVQRITYWDTWPFFLLLLSLLSSEWFLRKRWGMV